MTHWVDRIAFGNMTSSAPLRPKQPDSPYYGFAEDRWQEITRDLLRRQPLDGPTLLDAVLQSWEDIFGSTLGPAKIGVEILPAPQIMGFFLHELVPLRIARSSADWRRDASAAEKDLVYIPDGAMSVEIKTSSHRAQIFGNRSFGIDNPGRGKKAKSGYYCAINFEGWGDARGARPEITRVRYGWLDSTDWNAQEAETGQASSLPSAVYNNQLAVLLNR